MFKTEFEVMEIRDVRNDEFRIKHFLRGKKDDVMKKVENFKKNSKRYERVGKNGMIIWTEEL